MLWVILILHWCGISEKNEISSLSITSTDYKDFTTNENEEVKIIFTWWVPMYSIPEWWLEIEIDFPNEYIPIDYKGSLNRSLFYISWNSVWYYKLDDAKFWHDYFSWLDLQKYKTDVPYDDGLLHLSYTENLFFHEIDENSTLDNLILSFPNAKILEKSQWVLTWEDVIYLLNFDDSMIYAFKSWYNNYYSYKWVPWWWGFEWNNSFYWIIHLFSINYNMNYEQWLH